MPNPEDYVYCTHCQHFRIDKDETPQCIYESLCYLLDPEDSRPFKERLYYVEIKGDRA